MFESAALQRLLEGSARETVHHPSNPRVRIVVQARARDACEYCLMPTRSRFEIDHIIPVSHWSAYLDGRLVRQPLASDRGVHHLDNFAWSCSYCNAFKGNHVARRLGRSAFPLFHPHRDTWNEHFLLRDKYLFIDGMSGLGRATEKILAFNDTRHNGPVAARHQAKLDGTDPPHWAHGWGS
jgi:hypothetical protein